ncbi:MAG TPA: GNAT family N-acetyltransferase [Chloroflexota bacterium]|nr:GNAT family N-acetyltransferase [Chloroflexota bacterium]
MTIRGFENRDYERLAELGTTLDRGYAFTPAMLRHRDATMEPRVRFLRVAAELDNSGVVGFGRIMHIWWNFHPRRFQLRVEVDPRWQRQGIGAALFAHLLATLRGWDPEVVRSESRAGNEAAVSFLEHRGFTEWRRRWESVLDVASANVQPLVTAAARADAADIRIVTYGAEVERRGEATLARQLYDTEMAISRDEPAMEPGAETMSFERFCAVELDTPDAVAAGHFLALHGEQIVGVSRLMRDLNHPDVLRQAFTGVRPDYRGRGIAQALKLCTIDLARSADYREIRTSNDSSNAPMLHINDVIGFKRETPIVIFERRFDGGSTR